MEQSWNVSNGETKWLGEQPVTVLLHPPCPTMTDLGTNLGLHLEKSMTKQLSYGSLSRGLWYYNLWLSNKHACRCSHSAVYAAPKSGHWAYSSRLVGPPHQPVPGSHWFYNSRVLSPANLERLDPGPLTRSTSCAPPRHTRVSSTWSDSVLNLKQVLCE